MFCSKQAIVRAERAKDVAHGGHHANSSMFQFHRAPALEFCRIAVGRKASRIPKANWLLNAEFTFEGFQRDKVLFR